MRPIYLDNNATTQPLQTVTDAMLPFLQEEYGNPSSAHPMGQRARHAVEQTRRQVADAFGADHGEIIFTSGGTEAISLAIRGTLTALPWKRHVLISSVEHQAVRELAEALRQDGIDIATIRVDDQGRLDLEHLAHELRAETGLVSLLYANHETGVVTDVDGVVGLLQKHEVPLHLDAVQAVGKVPIHVRTLGADMLSFSAHKFHGPKGAGGLFVRKGHPLRAAMVGGSQESGLRAGTENVPGIVGMGVACQAITTSTGGGETNLAVTVERIRGLRERLEVGLMQKISGVEIHGIRATRLCNTTNLCIAGAPAELLLILMGQERIYASAGAACGSGSLEPSPVLLAMGYSAEHARSSIRFSLSRFTTEQEIDHVLARLPVLVDRVRHMQRP